MDKIRVLCHATLPALIFSVSLVLAPEAFAVRGGSIIPPESFSSVGYLEPACTAILISPNTIITANHCVEQAGNDPEYLKFTYTDLNGEEKTLQGIRFASMSRQLPKELALVRLNHRATNVELIEPWEGPVAPKGTVGMIAGFGATEKLPRSLEKRGGKVVLDGIWKAPEGSMIMANPGGGKRSNLPCGGDSGGPLIVDGKLYGIVSFGASQKAGFEFMGPVQQCIATETSYFVPITPYLKWIKKTLTELDGS
jgi:hypothetical protein